MIIFKKQPYADLNARQKENYNAHQLAAVLADYGYNCLRLTDDWKGADMLACHIDGNTFIKIQLKGRPCFNKKYQDKQIYIAFREEKQWYLYPHDILLSDLLDMNKMRNTESWQITECYSFPTIPNYLKKMLGGYKL